MKNTIEVFERVKQFIQDHINEYLDENNPYAVKVPKLTKDNFAIDFPDIDKMPQQNMIYIVPDYMNLSPQTTCTTLMDNNIKLYIMCKRDAHDNLIKRASTYFNALCQVCIRNTTLGGAVNLCELGSADYYPSVSAVNTISAFEVNLNLKYIFQV